ncbi:hypothetical protein [Hymenobacter sp. B1770]|uniref:hypothetical protein n=1 Tax=Hymenobacter sp. B1770 TaxID=1718788 RepID=UPI003CE81422
MPYETGTSGNPTGRPKGAANKATAAARETIAAALAGADAVKLAAQLDSLTGKDYIDAYVKLAEFVTPKLQRTALATDEANSRIEVTMNLGDARQSLLDKLIAARGVVE